MAKKVRKTIVGIPLYDLKYYKNEVMSMCLSSNHAESSRTRPIIYFKYFINLAYFMGNTGLVLKTTFTVSRW